MTTSISHRRSCGDGTQPLVCVKFIVVTFTFVSPLFFGETNFPLASTFCGWFRTRLFEFCLQFCKVIKICITINEKCRIAAPGLPRIVECCANLHPYLLNPGIHGSRWLFSKVAIFSCPGLKIVHAVHVLCPALLHTIACIPRRTWKLCSRAYNDILSPNMATLSKIDPRFMPSSCSFNAWLWCNNSLHYIKI